MGQHALVKSAWRSCFGHMSDRKPRDEWDLRASPPRLAAFTQNMNRVGFHRGEQSSSSCERRIFQRWTPRLERPVTNSKPGCGRKNETNGTTEAPSSGAPPNHVFRLAPKKPGASLGAEALWPPSLGRLRSRRAKCRAREWVVESGPSEVVGVVGSARGSSSGFDGLGMGDGNRPATCHSNPERHMAQAHFTDMAHSQAQCEKISKGENFEGLSELCSQSLSSLRSLHATSPARFMLSHFARCHLGSAAPGGRLSRRKSSDSGGVEELLESLRERREQAIAPRTAAVPRRGEEGGPEHLRRGTLFRKKKGDQRMQKVRLVGFVGLVRLVLSNI